MLLHPFVPKWPWQHKPYFWLTLKAHFRRAGATRPTIVSL